MQARRRTTGTPFDPVILEYGKTMTLRDPVQPFFRYQRIERPDDLPPQDRRIIDIAVLDMNHRWPNVGHNSLVHQLRETTLPLVPQLESANVGIRVLSFDVRSSQMIPDFFADRFLLYVGTGGPGHIDPVLNDGIASWSQGVVEDSSWLEPITRLFAWIRDHDDTALLAVCHTFGLVCRWSGAAEPVLRSEESGGKSHGLLENRLTDEAVAHPWFSRFSAELPDRRHHRIIDSRLFNLIPNDPLPEGAIPISYECGADRTLGPALTMIELARDRGGIMPRIFAMNHHPEVVDRTHAMTVLDRMHSNREVTKEWYEERVTTLQQQLSTGDVEPMLRLTSEFTLLLPIRFHLTRILRRRLAHLGVTSRFHEGDFVDRLPEYRRGTVRP